jgi:hypothetical protein
MGKKDAHEKPITEKELWGFSFESFSEGILVSG